MKTSQNRKGGKCKKVNTNGHLKENTVRDKTTQTCYATRQPSGVRMWHTTMQMRGLCSNTVHSHQGEEKLCLRSRQPSRELVREERKRISEMERLESKLDRSDRACQLRCSHRRSYSCTQPEIQSNLLQSIICKIGNHPQDCSTGITRQIHANGKVMKKLKKLAIIGGYAAVDR